MRKPSQELLEEWTNGPAEEEPEAELPPSELLYARLEWLAERKEALAAMVQEMEQSAIGAMLKMAPDDPDALLDEIAEQLLEQVARREAEMARLVKVRDAGEAEAEAAPEEKAADADDGGTDTSAEDTSTKDTSAEGTDASAGAGPAGEEN